jgi:hypothetical protein
MKMGVEKKGKERFFVLIETLNIFLFSIENVLIDFNDRDGIKYAKNCPTISEGLMREEEI